MTSRVPHACNGCRVEWRPHPDPLAGQEPRLILCEPCRAILSTLTPTKGD